MNARPLLALALACVPSLTLAQTSPSRVIPQNRADQTPPPAVQRQAPPPVTPTQAPTPQVAPFVLHTVRIEGSSLPDAALRAAYSPFLGRRIATPELQQISDAVAKAYEKSDVALYTVVVPDQAFADGALQLVAIEGRVEKTEVRGRPGRSRALVERYLAPLESQAPASRRTLQRSVSLIRDTPGLTSDVQLATGSRQGAVQVAADVTQQPVQFGLGVNNRGTAFLGRTQVQADVYFNGVLRGGDQTRLTYAAPTEPRLFQYYAIGHQTPLGATGATLQLNAGALRTRPRDTGLKGTAKSAGVQIAYPVIRGFNQDLYVTVGVDGLNSDNAFLGFTFSDDRTRAIRASAAWSRTDDKSLLALSGAVSQGVDGLGARATDPNLGKLAFLKANGRVTYNRTLFEPLTLRLTAAGQYARDRLPASEHFALGGDEFGRAFEASFIAGDYGHAASAELAWRPDFPAPLAGSELYGYVDASKVWYRGRYGFPTQSADLSSTGGGVRFLVARKAIVQLEAAKGLSNPIPSLDRDGWRGVFNVRTLF